MFYVYVMKSLHDGKHYIGFTKNIQQRLEDHNRGKNKALRGRGPFQVVYTEMFLIRKEAIQRERQIKRFKGGEGFKRLLKNYDPIV